MTDTLIERNPDILGGTPVFAGTRVPVRILMEHLEAGDRLDDFLTDYPPCPEARRWRCWNGPRRCWNRAAMKLLLDESVPRRLALSFPGSFTLHTVQEMGWAGTANGLLLSLAAARGFDALVTVDRSIEH